MRLLYLCSDFGISPSGTKGASVHLRAITRALSEAGHEIQLLSPKDGPDGDHPAQRLPPPYCPPADKYVKLLKRYLAERGLNSGVAKEIRPLFYNAWALDPTMDVLRQNPPDVILERLSLFGHVGVDLSAKLDIPLVLEVNAPLTEEATQYRDLQMGDLAREIEDRVLDHADAVVVVSRQLAKMLTERGVDPDKVHVISNGADVSAFQQIPSRDVCREELGLHDEFVVGFVGSLKPWHGVDVLLDAFGELHAKVPSARLVVVGSGPQEDELRHQAVDVGLGEVVRFLGAVPHDRVPALLHAMDVAVAPFHASSSFYFSPIKLFEYMAAATCVVASRIGQITEVVEDGVNGVLVDPSDKQDLFEKLHALSSDATRRRDLGFRGLETVRTEYTWTRAAGAMTEVLEKVRADRECPAIVSRIR